MNTPNNNQASLSPDRDSLVALDALLRIRESQARDSAMSNSNSGSTTNALSSLSNSFAASLNSLLPGMNAASMAMLMNSSQNHHAASMAASTAHYRLAAAQAAAATSWVAANAPPILSATVTTADSVSAPPISASAARERDQNQEHPDGKKGVSTKASIRREKVEEALRSKSQRGRKRDDLSEKERLELTRTRNREHAKSTRVRKKARYQELLDREERYLQLQEQEDLEDERRECIQDFFQMRQSMLLDQVQRLPDDQKLGGGSSQPNKPESSSSKLAELVDGTMPFEFDSFLPGGANADSDDAFAKMLEWDEALLRRMKSSFVESATTVFSTLTYEIESGPSSIALNKNDDAFCRVGLFVNILPSSSNAATTSNQASGKKKLVLSGICAFRFGPEQSSRLASLKWTTLQDESCSAGGVTPRSWAGGETDSNSSQPSRETLGSQLVHPSVVSLDHVRHSQHVDLDDSHGGPGMNI